MATTINGSAGVTTNTGAVYNGLQSGTAVTATGTSVDFTGIPSWVKRITVMFDSVSTNGTSQVIVQIGDSGGIENTGYSTYYAFILASTVAGSNANTNGFSLTNMYATSDARSGHLVLTNINGNIWIASAVAAGNSVGLMGGTKTLSATLDRIRITTVNGTDTFDAGTINIIYE